MLRTLVVLLFKKGLGTSIIYYVEFVPHLTKASYWSIIFHWLILFYVLHNVGILFKGYIN